MNIRKLWKRLRDPARCEFCRYSYIYVNGGGGITKLECRRFPPVSASVPSGDAPNLFPAIYATLTQWPTVKARDWCFEYRG